MANGVILQCNKLVGELNMRIQDLAMLYGFNDHDIYLSVFS